MSQKIQRWICIDPDCQQQQIIDTAQDLIQHSKLGHKLITYQVFTEQIKKYFTDANKSKLNNEEYYNQMKIEIQNYIEFYSQTIKELENNYLKIFNEIYDLIFPRSELIDLTKSIINEENIELSRRQFEPNCSEIKQFEQLQSSISFLCCQRIDLIDNFKKNLVLRQPPDICKPEVIKEKKQLRILKLTTKYNAELEIQNQQFGVNLDKQNEVKLQNQELQKIQNIQLNNIAQNGLFQTDNYSVKEKLNEIAFSADQQQQQKVCQQQEHKVFLQEQQKVQQKASSQDQQKEYQQDLQKYYQQDQQYEQQQFQQYQKSYLIDLEFDQQTSQFESNSEVTRVNNTFQLLTLQSNKLMQDILQPKQSCGQYDKKLSSSEIQYLGNIARCGDSLQNVYFKRAKQTTTKRSLVFKYKLLSETRSCDIQIGAIQLNDHNFQDMQGVYLVKSQGEIVREQEIQHSDKYINLLRDSTISCTLSKKYSLNIHQTICQAKEQEKKQFVIRVPLQKYQGFIDYRIIVRIKNIEIELL